MEPIPDSGSEMIHRLSIDVCLVELDGIYSYITRWGNIRDVFAYIGKCESANFYRIHGIDRENIKETAFNDLFVAMTEYDGSRAIGEFAGYHVFRSIREHIKLFGNLDEGEAFGIMKKPRVFELRYWPRYVPEHSLPCSLDWLALKHCQEQPTKKDTSAFWEKATSIALGLTGKSARNWEIVKARMSSIDCSVLAKEHSIIVSTISQTVKNTCRRMRTQWEYEDARGLAYA